MNLGLENKAVVVTGASKGIGYACATAFAAEGAKVAIISRSRANLDAALARFPKSAQAPIAIAADLIDPAAALRAIDAAEAALGPIDVLVNSAGAARRYTPDDLDAAAWRDSMNAKFFSYIYAIDVVVKRMAKRGQGAIVNIIGAGGKQAYPTHLPGGSANAALMLATVGLAAAYGPQGVRVNGINPGATTTERIQEGLRVEAKMTGLSEEDLLARGVQHIPLRRYATPEEVANVAVFLASSQASYVTGAIVPMDGGQGRMP
jgi:NAD(P)-dependent dehydrogenase (short-subunit alcohol dehydrogenase family)